MNFVFNRYAAITIGPSGYGDIVSLFSWLSVLTIPLAVMHVVIVKYIGSHGPGVAVPVEKRILHLFRTGGIGIALLVCAIPFVPSITHLSPVTGYVLVPLAILTCFAALYDSLLQSVKQFAWFSLISVGAVAIKVSGVFVGMVFPDPLVVMLVFIVCSYSVRIFVSRYSFHTPNVPEKEASHMSEKTFLRLITHKHVALSAVAISMTTLLSNSGILYVKQTRSAEDAGLFAAWMVASQVLLFIIGPLISMGYIFFSSEQTKAFHTKTVLVSCVLLLISGTGYVVAYKLFGGFIVHVLFGDTFTFTENFMVYAAVFGVGLTGVLLFTNYFLARGSRSIYGASLIVLWYVCVLYGKNYSLQDVMQISISTVYAMVGMYALVFIFQNRRVLQLNYAHPHPEQARYHKS